MTPLTDNIVADVAVRFIVEPGVPPRDEAIHDALRSVRAFEIHAPTSELAVLYGELLVEVLESAGNGTRSGTRSS